MQLPAVCKTYTVCPRDGVMLDGLDLACTDMDHMRSSPSKMVAKKSDHRSARSNRVHSVIEFSQHMDILQHTSTAQSTCMDQAHVGNTERYHYPMSIFHITLAQQHSLMVITWKIKPSHFTDEATHHFEKVHTNRVRHCQAIMSPCPQNKVTSHFSARHLQ